MRRARYQFGSVQRKPRRLGPDVWVYRYSDSAGKKRSVEIGDLDRYSTKKQALRAAEHLRLSINPDTAVQRGVTFGALLDRYDAEEMPARYSTSTAYRSYIRTHIRPKWAGYELAEVKAFAVEQWLKTLTLAPKSRNHIKTIMLNVFECAMRWEMVPFGRNPMSLVRVPGCSKRRKAPRVLSAAECQKLLAHLQTEPYRTMLMVAMSLGLRCSEWAALQWQDVDFAAGTISINRAIVVNRVDEVKTAYSGKTLPLHPMLASALSEQRNRSLWTGPGDWIFANPQSGGTKPYQPWKYAAKKMKEAAIQAGLGEGIGWHTFRHSYSSMLRDLQVDVKVQQELLRHADIRTTLNVYMQGVPENLRTANDLVVLEVLTGSIQ